MIQYNIYFGTIGKTLGVRYRFTKYCKDEQDALSIAKNGASSLYFKYEGKYGLPSYNKILKDSELTGVDIETLYKDYIDYYTRYWAIPTEVDTIPNRKIKW